MDTAPGHPALDHVAVNRALADERRLAVVHALRGNMDGLDVHALSERLGLHPNTVRWHLGVLGDAGLVVSRAAESHGPGRPRIVYRLSPEAAARGRDEHRILATVLTEACASLDEVDVWAESADYSRSSSFCSSA